MGEQIREHRHSQEETGETIVDIPHVEPEVDVSDIDKLLDEIDGVLEENAEEFVKAYQQRGGQ